MAIRFLSVISRSYLFVCNLNAALLNFNSSETGIAQL